MTQTPQTPQTPDRYGLPQLTPLEQLQIVADEDVAELTASKDRLTRRLISARLEIVALRKRVLELQGVTDESEGNPADPGQMRDNDRRGQ